MSIIDLSLLPPPKVIEVLDFEVILNRMKATLLELFPDAVDVIDLESEPAIKLLQTAAYGELIFRQRVNDAANAVMLAYAMDSDLDHLAALFGVKRLLVKEEDLETIPPEPAIYESDERLRKRTQLALEGFSTAGPEGAYLFHSLSADSRVKDISVQGPDDGLPAGEVLITVLSTENDGAASDELLTIVDIELSREEVRPLTDMVTIQSATIHNYVIEATMYFYDGPDSSLVIDQSQMAIEKYVAEQHKVGRDIAISGIYDALHQPGVSRVVLVNPTIDIIIDKNTAPFCTSITLINGGINE
jgi:phage-related baseplate assembly protein